MADYRTVKADSLTSVVRSIVKAGGSSERETDLVATNLVEANLKGHDSHGVGPQDLTIDTLVKRAHDPQVHEIILALNATVDGQTTAHYITDLLQEAGVKVTRLAHGVPVGGELDYLDEGTLAAAMRSRTPF